MDLRLETIFEAPLSFSHLVAYMLSLYRIWVGVERRRNQTKIIFLSGIASSVNVKHIQSYLERRNINPTHISVFPSKRKV